MASLHGSGILGGVAEVAMSLFRPVNLARWIEQHRDELKPPVGNKVVWRDERDTIVMMVAGPNKRKDYHVNATEEFFYQIKGDITLAIIRPDTGQPEDVIIREGDIYLLPANVPHSPRRAAGTLGLVIEQKRPAGARDRLQWYSDDTHELVYEAEFDLENIETDLKRIMNEFWSNEELRRCPSTGSIISPPTESQPPPPAAK
jgi:3-hydroxyanthranilate 3,4-dioxygenase